MSVVVVVFVVVIGSLRTRTVVCYEELLSYDMIAMQLKCKIPRNIVAHMGHDILSVFHSYMLYTVYCIYAKQLFENSFELLS